MANSIMSHPMASRGSRFYDFLPNCIKVGIAKPLQQLLAQCPAKKQRFKARSINKTPALHVVRLGITETPQLTSLCGRLRRIVWLDRCRDRHR